jgi:hypothetical protein
VPIETVSSTYLLELTYRDLPLLTYLHLPDAAT